MGREARIAKTRTCKRCKKSFLQMNAHQISLHGLVCDFEQKTGIEIIRMGPQDGDSST